LTARRQALGARGEAMAAEWYEANGYDVLARNWRCRDGEIDIVAARGGVVVVCEVKARTSEAFGSPAEAVDDRKQARLHRLGRRWLAESGLRGRTLRFDVACVLAGRLEVLEDAF
jgi:putative endonuclease